jgi:integrase
VVQHRQEKKEVQSTIVEEEEATGREVVDVERGEVQSTHCDVWTLYLYAMKSPVTREKYQIRFGKFLNFVLGLDAAGGGRTIQQKASIFVQKGRKDTNWAFDNILKFIRFQLDRVNKKEITGSTVRNYVKSIKLFCDMADIPIAWKKITRGLPRGRRYANYRIPTLEEIRKLVDYPDRRIKAIVYTMASSGIRLGAWDYLQWGHIQPVERNAEVVAAKMIVYAGEEEEYFTFISPKAWRALEDWMNYRDTSGEIINNYSWVMRDLWDSRVAQGRGLVTVPKKLSSLGVKRLMERAIWAQGLRKKLEPGKKRHPYQANHSLRKWFKTRCEIAGMKPINIEKLMNHSTGISDSYYRATENELLDDYLKAVDLLSINYDRLTLQKQVAELTEKSKEENYIIKGKLSEKEKEIQLLRQRDSMNSDAIATLSDQLTKVMQEIEILKMQQK